MRSRSSATVGAAGAPGARGLRIADLDGDGTGEVLVTGHASGAHCHDAGRIVYRPAGATADRILRVE